MPHQREMLRYLRSTPHGALFCEMRTGKTMPTIRRCQSIRPRDRDGLHILIVAPNSALGGWERELRLEGEDDVAYLQGPRAKRLATLLGGHRWNLLNREGWRSLPEIADRPWDVVVCDESTFLKNPRARVTKFFLTAFRDVRHRVVLTGMPNPESELDLWCQMAFLHGSAFRCGSYWQFRAGWFQQEPGGYDWTPRKSTREMMEGELAEKALRMRRQDVGMPDQKVHETRHVAMPAKLRESYDAAEQDFVLEDDGRRLGKTIYAGARWQWMRQMCGGFVASPTPGEHGRLAWKGKLNEARGLLKSELAREQVVVWFCYNQEIHAALDYLGNAGVSVREMTGLDRPKARREMVTDFAAGKFRVFLIQQMVAEFGMDLSAADTAIIYSRHAALQTNMQSADRILHPRKTCPLLYVDLVVPNTVDEDVANLIWTKRWRSQRLLDAAVWDRMRRRAG